MWGPTQLLHRARRRRARARSGRHAAVSCIEVGGVGGLHRACTMQRHAGALINGARSCRQLEGAERAADRRSGASCPLMLVAVAVPAADVVESCACGTTTAWSVRHRASNFRIVVVAYIRHRYPYRGGSTGRVLPETAGPAVRDQPERLSGIRRSRCPRSLDYASTTLLRCLLAAAAPSGGLAGRQC